MKKLIYVSLASMLALATVSCNKEDSQESTYSQAVKAYNLYIPLSGDAEPTTALTSYTFTTKFPEKTIEIVASNLSLPGGMLGNFSTKAIPLTSTIVNISGENCQIVSFKADDPAASGDRITKLSGEVSQTSFAPGKVQIPGYERLLPSEYRHNVVMQYVFENEWEVRTFWPDMTFCGETTTTFPGMDEPFTSGGISYRVVMKLKGDAIQNKADIILYNAKFAPQAPEITVVLRDLDLQFSKQGYRISGENVVPCMVEAGELQETPRYAFDKIEFNATGDMVQGVCSYTVAGVFKGSFKGASMYRE